MKMPTHFTAAVLGGVFLGIGSVVPQLWPLSLVSLVFLIYGFSPTSSLWKSYTLGFFAFAACFGLTLYPMSWNVLLPDNLLSHQVMLIALAWGMSVLGSSIPAALFAPFTMLFATRSWKDLIVLPSAFTVFLSLSFWSVDALYLGDPIRFGGHSTLSSPAYLLANDPTLLQISWALGIYGLLFVIGFIGTLLYRIIFGNNVERRTLTLISLTLLIIWIGVRTYIEYMPVNEAAEQSLTAIALAAELPVKSSTDPQAAFLRFEIMDELVQKAEPADIFVFPEDASFLEYAQKEAEENSLRSLQKFGIVVDSTYADENLEPLNRIRYFDPKNETSEFSYKWFLAPFGEYLPFWMRGALKTPLLSGIADDYYENKIISSGNPSVSPEKNGVRIGALLCVEAVTPYLYREHVKNGATILANLSSLRSYKDSPTSALVMERIYKVRAAENRRFMIVSSDSAPAYIINPYGTIISQSSAYGLAQGHVSVRNDITPYTHLGPLALTPFILLSVWGMVLGIRKRRSSLRNSEN